MTAKNADRPIVDASAASGSGAGDRAAALLDA
jgi:hypothetical protein